MKKNNIFLSTITLVVLLATTLSFAQCWQSKAVGYANTAGIKVDGSLWTYGINNSGQSGGAYAGPSSNIPLQVGVARNWASVTAGYAHLHAIKTDGTLWSWGYNVYGMLGDGTYTTRNVPVQIGTGTNWSNVVAGYAYSMAIKTDGTLWGWGYNGYGQLGDGTTVDKITPIQIGTATNWKKIALGYGGHTLAIKTDGSLWAWGLNTYGQLGDGTTTQRLLPVQIGTGTNWKNVDVGFAAAYVGHTVATKTDGTLWAWGYNNQGQLGDGTVATRISPVQIGTLTDWDTISTGYGTSASIKSDGTLWTWGYNAVGQLGDGTTVSKLVPTKIGTATDWKSVYSSEYYSTIGLRTNGDLYSWGYNGYGELGDGSNANKSTPNFVVCPVTSVLNVADNEFNEFKVYPNPFSNKFSINIASDATLSITDITGKKLKSQSISTGITQIDMENYSAGIYFLSISTDKSKSKDFKIIKE